MIDSALVRVQKTSSTQAQSEESWVETNPDVEGKRVNRGLAIRLVSPPKASKVPQPLSLTGAEDGVEPPTQPSATDSVEAPQPEIAATVDNEADQLPRPEPTEATAGEDGQSVGASMSTATLSAPSPDVATMSTQLAKEEEVISVTGPGTQL